MTVILTHETNPWPLQYFVPREFKCKLTGRFAIPLDTALALDRVRLRFGSPLRVVSAYRSPEHNRAVGGADASFHMSGNAFDIATEMWSATRLADFFDISLEEGFLGHGLYRSHAHIDRGARRVWLG